MAGVAFLASAMWQDPAVNECGVASVASLANLASLTSLASVAIVASMVCRGMTVR